MKPYRNIGYFQHKSSRIMIGMMIGLCSVLAFMGLDCHTPQVCNVRNSTSPLPDEVPGDTSVCEPNTRCGLNMVIYPTYDFTDIKGDIVFFYGEVAGNPFYFNLDLEGVKTGSTNFILCHQGFPSGKTFKYSFHLEDAAANYSRTMTGSFITGDETGCGQENVAPQIVLYVEDRPYSIETPLECPAYPGF